MEWKHLPKEIKREILSHAVDLRTLVTIRNSVIRSNILLTCKEFKTLITSLLSWGGGNPFEEVKLAWNSGSISSAWGDYLFVTRHERTKHSYFSINRMGLKENLPSEVFSTEKYLFILVNESLKVFSSFPFKEPLIVVEPLSKYLPHVGPYSLRNVKDTPLGTLLLILDSEGDQLLSLDLERKNVTMLLHSEAGQIISPWGIGMFQNEDDFILHKWASLEKIETLKRNYDVIIDSHKMGNSYYESSVGYSIASVYSDVEKLLWNTYIEAGSYMGYISPEIQGLLILYKDQKSVIIDILTSEPLYKTDETLFALTLSKTGKYLLWYNTN